MTVENTAPETAAAPAQEAPATDAPATENGAEAQEGGGDESFAALLAAGEDETGQEGEEGAEAAPAEGEESPDEDGEDAESDEDKDDEESEDKKANEDGKPETRRQRQRREVREAKERAEKAEQAIAAKQTEVTEAFKLLSEANRDVEQYEVALISERAKFDRLLALVQSHSEFRLKPEHEELLSYSALTAAQKAQEAIGHTVAQVTQAAQTQRKQTTEAHTKTMVSTVNAVTSALNVDRAAFVAFATPYIRAGQMDTPQSVGELARAYIAQQAQPAPAPDVAAHVAPRVDKIRKAPSVIQPTDVARPGYSRDLQGWRDEMLSEP